MNRVTTSLIFAALACTTASARAADAGLNRTVDLEARELYIQFYPSDKLLTVREYGLSTLLTDAAAIEAQVVRLQQLVSSADYCKTRYGLTGFATGQEVLFATRRTDAGAGDNEAAAHVECVLVTATDMPDSMRTAFATLLGRDVTVSGTRQEITLEFGSADLTIGPNNALQSLFNRNTAQGRLVWRNGERFYEAVFINQSKAPDAFRAIYPHVPAFPVSSPALDKEKVDALRATLVEEAQ
jgi:hypothetical protein